jgi:hypothetical protein
MKAHPGATEQQIPDRNPPQYSILKVDVSWNMHKNGDKIQVYHEKGCPILLEPTDFYG